MYFGLLIVNLFSSSHTHNKLFKSDSARVAFLLCFGSGVEVPCLGLVIACFTP